MARRRELVGIADAVAVLFCSRSNDFEGAWLPGVLCARLVDGASLSATVDLGGSVSDDLLGLVAARSRSHIDRHLARIGLEPRLISSAMMTIDFRPRVPSLSREGAADRVVGLDVETWWFTVTVSFVDDFGVERRASRQEWCWAERRPLPIGGRAVFARQRGPSRSAQHGRRSQDAGTVRESIDHSAEAIAVAITAADDGDVRIAGRALRDRLRVDPSDVAVRRALATIYRDAGHPEHAGRYEVTLPHSPKPELEAYVRVLIATNADDAEVRKLSVLAEGEPIPERLREEVARQRAERTAIAPWGTLAGSSLAVFGVALLFTLLAVFFTVLFAPGPAAWIARAGGLVCGSALACAFAGAAGVAWNEQRRVPWTWWTIAALLAACGTALGVVAFVAALG